MKPFLRRLMVPLSRFHRYQGDVAGWAGYYRFAGVTVAFKGTDDTLSFNW
jgi:hypothetical protein